MRGAAALGATLAGVAACAGGEGRDVVPASRDVVVSGAAAAAAATEDARGYAYVARRPLAVVALAGARGLEASVARAAVDRLADALDACVTEEAHKGPPVEGAARVVAAIEPSGAVGPPSVRVDPGAGVAASAILCLVAPARLLTFPPVDAGARGLAVDALWGRLVPSSGDAATR